MSGALALMMALIGWTQGQAQTTNGHWLTGYYATYNNSVMSTSQVDYTKLTHVIYWPVIPNANGTLNETPFGLAAATFSSGATDLISRAHAAGAKALIGIGGDAGSGATAGFEASTQPAYQATFIENILTLMQTYGFDGVDINWEQIQQSDNSDFTSFIQNLRNALDTLSPDVHLLLTMAPETQANGGRPDLLAQVYPYLDQINIQTYQMSGPYCGWQTWYNSPLNNGGATFILNPSEQLPSITNAIADYTSLGIPASKLGMGIQFYAEEWTGGQGTSTGGVTMPDQTWTGDSNPTYCSGTGNPYAPTVNTVAYSGMITTLAGTPGYTVNFDPVADQSWLSYDPSGTGATNESQDRFVSYDSPESIAKKGQDLSPQPRVGGALGGVFIFELSGDFASAAAASQQHPLLNAAHAMRMLLPGLVTNLTATPGAGTVSLSWTAANGATSYQISYSTSSGGAETPATTVSGTAASISNLALNTQYWFQVTPVNAFGAGVAAQATATIGLITPTVTWASPAPIPYGTPLSSIQLDATASVPGTFVYTPGSGTILWKGTRVISVVFTPQSPYYATITKSVPLIVYPAPLSTSDNFGNVDVGMESNVHALMVTLPAATTILSEIQVLTSGVSDLDFESVAGGSCAVGQTYPPGSSCTVYVTFTPTVSGLRQGTVVLYGVDFRYHYQLPVKLTQDVSGVGVSP